MPDGIILPGLINAHTHVMQILLRGGAAKPKRLYDWLVTVLYPGLAQYTGEDALLATQLYCTEAIRAGITTIVENSDWGHDRGCAEGTIAGLDRMGVRAIYARLFYDVVPAEFEAMLARMGVATRPNGAALGGVEDGQAAIDDTEDLVRQYDGSADGRIRVWPAPAMPQTTTPKALHAAFELAESIDGMAAMHVAQSQGKTPRSKAYLRSNTFTQRGH